MTILTFCVLLCLFIYVCSAVDEHRVVTGWNEDDIDEAMAFVEHHIHRPISAEMDKQQGNFCPSCFQLEIFGVCMKAAMQAGQLKRLNQRTLPLYKKVLAQTLGKLGHDPIELDSNHIEDFFKGHSEKKAVCEKLVSQFPVWDENFWFTQFDDLENKVVIPRPKPQPPKVKFRIVLGIPIVHRFERKHG